MDHPFANRAQEKKTFQTAAEWRGCSGKGDSISVRVCVAGVFGCFLPVALAELIDVHASDFPNCIRGQYCHDELSS